MTSFYLFHYRLSSVTFKPCKIGSKEDSCQRPQKLVAGDRWVFGGRRLSRSMAPFTPHRVTFVFRSSLRDEEGWGGRLVPWLIVTPTKGIVLHPSLLSPPHRKIAGQKDWHGVDVHCWCSSMEERLGGRRHRDNNQRSPVKDCNIDKHCDCHSIASMVPNGDILADQCTQSWRKYWKAQPKSSPLWSVGRCLQKNFFRWKVLRPS